MATWLTLSAQPVWEKSANQGCVRSGKTTRRRIAPHPSMARAGRRIIGTLFIRYKPCSSANPCPPLPSAIVPSMTRPAAPPIYEDHLAKLVLDKRKAKEVDPAWLKDYKGK